ncbi:L,D-transpeptidase [Streptobacillus felis]|uniref:L,D-transpeptidase family protein n=1 Tax=Streptobacillus felis TaxID=1384509 RepID=UPI0039EA8688
MKKYLMLLLLLGMYNINYAKEENIDIKEENVAIKTEEKKEETEKEIVEEVVEKKEEDSKEEVVEEKNYVEKFESNEKNITLNLKFDKYFDESLNKFAYVKVTTNIRNKPTTKGSKVLSSLKTGTKLPLLGIVKGNDGKEWLEVMYKNQKAYIFISNALVRGFNWQKAAEKANKLNDFIANSKLRNKEIYYLDSYVSLNTESSGKKDKYGNAANQSIKAYYNNNKEYINLPDRTLVTLEGQDDKYVYIKTASYGDITYAILKSDVKRFKKSNINKKVNRFIYIDRDSQTQVTLERSSSGFNVNTVGYVTTGITKGAGFVTPYGDFLVAYTKPVMAYASDFQKEPILNSKGEKIGERPIVIVDARFAIRFSGGGYLHGIPSTFEPKENREARKRATAAKLGTIPLSHKCVRNEDDVIEYLYRWVNGKNKIQKNGFTYPEEHVIVIVD